MLETETTLGTLTAKEFNTRTLGIYKIVGRVGGVGLTVAALINVRDPLLELCPGGQEFTTDSAPATLNICLVLRKPVTRH